MDRRSFLTWNQHELIEAGTINGLADSAKRLKPLLTALALIEEVLSRSFNTSEVRDTSGRSHHRQKLPGGQFLGMTFFGQLA